MSGPIVIMNVPPIVTVCGFISVMGMIVTASLLVVNQMRSIKLLKTFGIDLKNHQIQDETFQTKLAKALNIQED